MAITDTGATSIFIMEGTKVANKRVAVKPLKINLPNGNKIMSPHICDINIPGLPTVLTGHIVPSLAITSRMGICPLCKAGCTVVFNNKNCDVMFKDKFILCGYKDPTTNLWMLPIPNKVCTTPGPTILPWPGPCLGCAPHLPIDASNIHPGVTLATFTHSVQTQACENILLGYLYDGDLVFVILKGISIFEFPKRFLEISSRDLALSFLLRLT